MYIRSGFQRSARRYRFCMFAFALMAGVFGIGTASAQQLPGDEKAQSKAAEDKAPATVRSWDAPLPPPGGAFRSDEVLAHDLSPAARERLRQLGYELKDSGAGLVRIVASPSADAWTAQRELASEFSRTLEYFHLRPLHYPPNVPGPP